MRLALPGAILFLLFLVPAAPGLRGQADFDYTVTFGDSLTHNDILWMVYGTTRDLYEDDPNEAVFRKGAAAGDSLANYAVAGSTSVHVGWQVDTYLFFEWLGLEDTATLVGFEIGGNDILGADDILKASPPGVDPQADAIIDGLIARILSNLQALYIDLHCQILVWTIPDVTQIPDYYGALTPQEIDNLRAHIERANAVIRSLDQYPMVTVADVYQIVQDFIASPPVIQGTPLVPPPQHGDYADLFADEVHPTAVTNALLANEFIQAINAKWHDVIPFYTEQELADLAHIAD